MCASSDRLVDEQNHYLLAGRITAVNVSIDGTKLLYAVGVLLGVVALGYFGFELLTGLSPTITAILLAIVFVGLLSVALTIDGGGLETVTYALTAGSYLVTIAYVLSRFDLGDVGVFLVLALSSALFVGLGYGVRERGIALTRPQTARIVVVLAVATALLVGVDVVGAQPTYEVETEDEIEMLEPREQRSIGTVTAENGFVLSRSVDSVTLRICVTGPEPEQLSAHAFRSQVLAGGESVEGELTIAGGIFYDRDGEPRDAFADLESIPVDTHDGTECPTDDEVRLVVLTGDLGE